MYPGPYQRRRPPVRRRRRHSHKVYVRRQILALVVAIGCIFVVLLGLDHLVHVAFPSHHNASASKSKKHHTISPVTVPPTTTTTVDAPAGGNSVTISAVGDTMLGNESSGLPPSPATYLSYVQAALAEPVVFGNLEGTLTSGGTSKCTTTSTDCYAYRVPPSYATYLKDAGFTVLNSANNHSHDFGSQGVSDTTSALTSADIEQTGLPGQIAVVTYKKTKVAFVGFAPYSDTNDLLRPTIAKQLIDKAKTMAPVVIVYMHAGAEGATADHVTGKTEYYDGEDRGNPEVFAHDAINDGASVVIASGPHVLRGMEFYNGHLIDYSLGDFAGYNNFAVNPWPLDLSGILRFKVSGSGKFISATWVSLLLNSEGQPDVDTSGQAAVFVNQLSNQDFGANAAKIEPTGQIVPAG